MKALLWVVLVCIGLLPVVSYADDNSYDRILKQLEAKDGSEIATSAAGPIDGEQYLAVISRHELGELLTVFKRASTRYIGVAQTKYLPSFSTVAVAKNSIFLETGFCHHGCSDDRYQFKNIDQMLRLVGVESQGDTNSCYYDEKNAPSDCEKYEVRSGASYNLLASTTICWLETTYVADEQQTRPVPPNVPKSYQPRGIQHRMALQRISLPSLNGFDSNNLSIPKSCYFDFKKRLHK
jgi:hypothetical protein